MGLIDGSEGFKKFVARPPVDRMVQINTPAELVSSVDKELKFVVGTADGTAGHGERSSILSGLHDSNVLARNKYKIHDIAAAVVNHASSTPTEKLEIMNYILKGKPEFTPGRIMEELKKAGLK